MTAEEADDLIIQSRQTLSAYVRIAATFTAPTPGVSDLVSQEVAVLNGISEHHPDKAPKLSRLISAWVAYRDGLKQRLH